MKKARLFSVFLLAMFVSVYVNAQEFNLGADLVSRYVWRGFDFGNTASIQPGVSFGYSGLEAGFWGSYPLTTTSNGSEEIDTYISYTLSTENSGEFTLSATDYYYPNSGLKIGNFKDKGNGAHTIEAALGYAGPENLPISLLVAANVYNDDENNIYFQAGYSTALQDVGVDVFIGGTPGSDNALYGTTEFNLINVGLTLSKEIKITDSFSLPVFGSYILNPNSEVSYLVFGVSL
ncbi:MAG: hypothetical protein GXX85_17095 [Ignavibacteria bacterium]|nr:hypothetical protein [Ignavibacteria bacterium]